MVRLVNGVDLKKIAKVVFSILKIQEIFTRITEVKNPNIRPCVYAMWHAHQFSVHGLPYRAETNVLVSRSKDGEVIADVVEHWGFKTVRGSKGRSGAVEASMHMIDALKNGENCAMMVDGPKGPVKVAKDGAIKIAKLAGVPVIPLYWYSPNPGWIKFPSWDGLRMPIGPVNLINLYGEPIYVSADGTDEDDKKALEKLQSELERLEKEAPIEYNKVYKFGIWKRNQKK